MGAYQGRLREQRGELGIQRLQALGQQLLHLATQLGVIGILGQVYQTGDKICRLPHQQPNHATLL